MWHPSSNFILMWCVYKFGVTGRDRSDKDLKDDSFRILELGDARVEGTVVLPKGIRETVVD